ncbi:helix-turn-helix domain-containing protein [Jeotgalicoccus meleagridis]|uniref:Helix-turn-helix domain protein n=1 Tax=Jeotgalicoccus meleagridis TaxID=2759181 RepID=A0A6V7RM55_9STAP|nr:helix-turn-helix domain-containing protein [Jeotgalicoccus meleagridis]CAD2079036.1 Helix-turn-helix domain protein [Jeotgalicoccus meleagridis]
MNIGTYLKNKREKSGITLREMERGSGLKKSVILTIESGDLSALPEPKHARFLIKQYCKYLKIDSDKLLERFKDDLPDVKEIGQKRNQKEDQDFQYLKKVLLGFVTLIVVFFVIWIILLQIGSEGDIFESKKIYDVDSEVAQEIEPKEEPKEEAKEEVAKEEEKKEDEAETPSTTVNFVNREGNTLIYNVTTSEAVELSVEGDESSWISLSDDLDNSYIYGESTGDTVDIEEEATVLNLALGNSTTFDITVNGETIDNSQRGNTVTVYYQFNITREGVSK